MRTTIIFDNFGPYHLARLLASARANELAAVQVYAKSSEHAWENESRNRDFKLVTLFPGRTCRDVQAKELNQKISELLDECRPEVVFIPGWSSREALAALHWCVRHKIPAVSMSESTEWDERRVGWKEWVKRKIVGLCSAALVGGRPQAAYLIKLGMPSERIFLGYDAVDNDYFAAKAAEAIDKKSEVRKKFGLPENYFLASARFIEKKNLSRLLQAYAHYRNLGEKSGLSATWPLILLGDGPLRDTLQSQILSLNLHGHVILPGFKQYPDLPAYYGLAGAFIHASTVEQWGLVVNEAMASGLPVVVSNRCGCAQDLVRESRNGFTFDPYNVEELAQFMLNISTPDFHLSEFGLMSQQIIADWGLEEFAQGLQAAADMALKIGPSRTSWGQGLLLKMLLQR